MKYEEFCEIVRAGIASGEIKTTAELNELDIAIQYAIGQEMQERGGGELHRRNSAFRHAGTCSNRIAVLEGRQLERGRRVQGERGNKKSGHRTG